MNIHEEKLLVELGARECDLFGKRGLDVSTIRATSADKTCLFAQALVEVVGRSGANRRHVDRRGCPIYVVTDFYTLDQQTVAKVRVDEEHARRLKSASAEETRERAVLVAARTWRSDYLSEPREKLDQPLLEAIDALVGEERA